jgi:hypothetical protein
MRRAVTSHIPDEEHWPTIRASNVRMFPVGNTPVVVRQSRLMSFAEAWAGVIVGFGINYLANLYLLPLWGLRVRPAQALSIGLVFTIISLARSYALRRVFEGVGR